MIEHFVMAGSNDPTFWESAGGFLTSTSSPWWSGPFGIVIGGVLAFITANYLEKHRQQGAAETRKHNAEEAASHREREAAEARRVQILDLVASFDAAIEDYRRKMFEDWGRWGQMYPEEREEDIETESWSTKKTADYAHLRAGAGVEMNAASAVFSRIRLLADGEISDAAVDVWNALKILSPGQPDHAFWSSNEAVQNAVSILRTLAVFLFLPERAEDSGRFNALKNMQTHQRAVIDKDAPRVLRVFVPENTHSALFNLKEGEALQIGRAQRYVAKDFLDGNMSAAVFALELEDGSTDFYAIGLETEGEPVTNATQDVWDDDETPNFGTLTQIRIDENGEVGEQNLRWNSQRQYWDVLTDFGYMKAEPTGNGDGGMIVYMPQADSEGGGDDEPTQEPEEPESGER